jgi:hypothetical protein
MARAISKTGQRHYTNPWRYIIQLETESQIRRLEKVHVDCPGPSGEDKPVLDTIGDQVSTYARPTTTDTMGVRLSRR